MTNSTTADTITAAPITVYYLLSEAGQRAALKAGLDAGTVQSALAPDNARGLAVELAQIDAGGRAEVMIGGRFAFKALRVEHGGGYARSDQYRYQLGEWAVEQGRGEVLAPTTTHYYQRARGTQARVAAPQFDVPLTAGAIAAALQDEHDRRVAVAESEQEAKSAVERLNAAPSAVHSREQAKAAAARDLQRHKEVEAEREERREREERLRAESKRDRMAVAAEWIGEHGSEHLRRVLAEELLPGSMRLYILERLALERPGWILDGDWHGGEVNHLDPRNVTAEHLELLAAARETAPDADLQWASYGDPDSMGECYGDDGECYDAVREMVATATWMDRAIVYRDGSA